MNRLIALLLVALLLTAVGCQQECDLADQNKAIVLAANEAMNNQLWDELDEYFAPDFRRHCQATPEVEITSLEQMVDFAKGWYTAFPDAFMEMRKVAAENDLVAVWATFTGTHMAPMGPFPATGQRIESETFAFFRIEQGMIKELWVTWDNVAVFNQLGLPVPPPPEPTE